MNRQVALSAAVAALTTVALTPLRALATSPGPLPIPIPVPEPGSLTLLSSGVVVGVLAYRWIRRR